MWSAGWSPCGPSQYRLDDDWTFAEYAHDAATSRAGNQPVTSMRTQSFGPPLVVMASSFGVVAPLSGALVRPA
jgi:hypothetical protein